MTIIISLCDDDLSIRLGNLITFEIYHVALKSFVYYIIYSRVTEIEKKTYKTDNLFCLDSTVAIVLTLSCPRVTYRFYSV